MLFELRDFSSPESHVRSLESLQRSARQLMGRWDACATGGELRAIENEYRDLTGQLADYQTEIVDHWVRDSAAGQGNYYGYWENPIRYGPASSTTCPSCRQPALRVYPASSGLSKLSLMIGICSRYGDITAIGAADLPVPVRIDGPGDVPAGSAFRVRVHLGPGTDPVILTVGAAVVDSDSFGASLTGPSQTVVLSSGDRRTVEFDGQVDGKLGVPDRHFIGVFIVANGRLCVFVSHYFVTPSASSSTARSGE